MDGEFSGTAVPKYLFCVKLLTKFMHPCNAGMTGAGWITWHGSMTAESVLHQHDMHSRHWKRMLGANLPNPAMGGEVRWA
jgi:hypothetical protein